jgi:hypothetical protein
MLRESMDAAASMADELEAAVDEGEVEEAVLARHSKWCHTGGSWSAGMEPARAAARAMYGTIPERLLDADGSRSARYDDAVDELISTTEAVWIEGSEAAVRGCRHADTGEAISTAHAHERWAGEARSVLLDIASRYDATITYKELAEAVQERTHIVTTQLMHHWVGRVLGHVSDHCASAGEPLLSALCVTAAGRVGPGYASAVARGRGQAPEDPELHAAAERLACYRRWARDLPADGGRPSLTGQEASRRERARQRRTASAVPVVCPHCRMRLPLSGQCDTCG